jgi:hypothetical protein
MGEVYSKKGYYTEGEGPITKTPSKEAARASRPSRVTRGKALDPLGRHQEGSQLKGIQGP